MPCIFLTHLHSASGQYLVRFDPVFGGGIYEDAFKLLSKVVLFPDPQAVCFMVVMYSQCNAKYQLTTPGTQRVNILAEGTKIVRKVPKITDKRDLAKRFRKPTVQINTTSILTKKTFASNEPFGEQPQVQNPGCEFEDLLVSFPQDVLVNIPLEMECHPDPNVSNKIPSFPMYVADEKQHNEISVSPTTIYEVSDEHYNFVNYVYGECPYIDPISGKVTDKTLKMNECHILPQITPYNYSTLPIHVLNYLTRGYTNMAISEAKSVLLTQLLGTDSIPIEDTLSLFGIDFETLVQHLIRMLFSVEEIDVFTLLSGCCPIRFEANVMGGHTLPAYLTTRGQAINRIFDFIKANNKQEALTSTWSMILQNQFLNHQAHTSYENNPNVVIRCLNEISSPFIYNRPGVDGWIVMRASLGIQKTPMCQVNGTDLMDNIVSVHGSELNITFSTKRNLTFVAIPVKQSNTSSLAGTFLELLISMKYFVYWMIELPKCEHHRRMVYNMIFKAFIARSPSFVQYMSDILQFLNETIPIHGSDMTDAFVTSLNLLAIYCNQFPKISAFLSEKKILYDERILVPFKAFFQELLTPDDVQAIEAYEEELAFRMPSNPWKRVFDASSGSYSAIISNIRRVIKDSNKFVGFPAHLIVHLWVKEFKKLLPFSINRKENNIVEVNFTAMMPSKAKVIAPAEEEFDLKVITNDRHHSCKSSEWFTVTSSKFDLQVVGERSWSNMNWTIVTEVDASAEEIVKQHKKLFLNDLRQWTTMFNYEVDMSILDRIPTSVWQNKMTLDIDPSIMVHSSLRNIPVNLAVIRGYFLVMINWLTYHKFLDMGDPEMECMSALVSPAWKVENFRKAVIANSNESKARLTLYREAAADVRDGDSSDLEMTLISQMTRQYKDPSDFRRCANDPWRIELRREHVIDIGGAAREIMNDAVDDFACPNCGLVVQVPNGRNEMGDFRECVIPVPNERHKNIAGQYKFVGVLIGMAVRTGLVQNFNFPPLVWRYLVSKTISIESIYEIDQNFMALMTSLEEALARGMDEEMFNSRFNLTFVTTNSAGVECPLKQRGKSEPVTLSTCRSYIALSKEFRLNELKTYLDYIREGLLENLMFDDMRICDWRSLKLSASGSDEVTTDDIRSVTIMYISERQQEIFWQVVDALNNQQKLMLLKFWTGTKRLMFGRSQTLKVDTESGQQVDYLPGASTCFHALHWPGYSSFDVALRQVVIAIEFAGTFETD